MPLWRRSTGRVGEEERERKRDGQLLSGRSIHVHF